MVLGILTVLGSWSFRQYGDWTESTPLYQVLYELGEEKPKHYLAPTPELVKKGEEIVKKGYTTSPSGRRTKPVSKYYVCTTCHNLEREDPDLKFSNPETRLPYVKEKGIPFLQGSTFWGIVNRESWYNDDYVKKYGDEKIEIAHKNLRESIQLCAIECSQGRPMDEWEIDAVLAYYWTLEYKLSDLNISEKDWQRLRQNRRNTANAEDMRSLLKSYYLQTAPAHFYNAPPDKSKGYEGLVGRPDVGKDVYELSCLWCHNSETGVSHYVLDNSKLSFKHLNKMIPKDAHFSLYQIIAYGTYAIPGHKPYMPHYPEEKLSKQQVEDLRAYVEMMAK